jgi:hypothetical protein
VPRSVVGRSTGRRPAATSAEEFLQVAWGVGGGPGGRARRSASLRNHQP